MDFAKTKAKIYKNNKTFYQKSAELRLLEGWPNLKKKKFIFALGPKMTTYEFFYTSTWKGGKKRLKKWTLPKQKLKYINNKTFY